MKTTVAFPYLALGLFLLGWTSVSYNASDQIRALAVDISTPAWHYAKAVKEYLSDRPIANNKKGDSIEWATRRNPDPPGPGQASYLSNCGKERAAPCRSGESLSLQEGVLHPSLLKLENQRLKTQLEWAKEWVLYKANLQHEKAVGPAFELLDLQYRAILAPVIYRDPGSWSSSLWIGIGEEDNPRVGDPIVAQNSPVVEGSSLIGVVEYVGKRQSRVRLITDSGLTPAVRVVREGGTREIVDLIDALSERLKARDEFFEFVRPLQDIKEKLNSSVGEVYLAKGELRGTGTPFWRSKQPILKGVGFNCDYADADGPARDLRTGRPLDGSNAPISLILEGDRLVTSGLDGVFPRGLSVAITTAVFPLREGSFSYEIEARPTAQNLNDLNVVFVLPPLRGE